MQLSPAVWNDPASHLKAHQPDRPVFYFAPEILRQRAEGFLNGYPGLVSYAVKANDGPVVLENLLAAGVGCFDVASVPEMLAVRAACPTARLHYNNPVRSPDEIRRAVEIGVCSYSIDSFSELDKLITLVPAKGIEIAVRLKLPVLGAKYDFGDKFGAEPAHAQKLLRRVADLGFTPSMTFHPGTQCADPAAWVAYIGVCADIARGAGVTLSRLNTGGGYAAHRGHSAPDLMPIFTAIRAAVQDSFGDTCPALLCEPGRAMVTDAFTLATRVKAVRDDGSVFLNDGIYGGFGESPSMGTVERVTVVSPIGAVKSGPSAPRQIWGPTCDSLDQLPKPVVLPTDISDGDYVLFHGMGAYASATVTRFNGYGDINLVTVKRL